MLLQFCAKVVEMETYPNMISHGCCVPCCLFEIFLSKTSQSDLSSVPISILDLITFVSFLQFRLTVVEMILDANVAVSRGQETASYLPH